MEFFRKLFCKQISEKDRKTVIELTEFELSESYKLVLGTENIVEGLLHHISAQKDLIKEYEKELSKLRHIQSLNAEDKIMKEGIKCIPELVGGNC
ncbi:MAG: hypothetical protein EOO46_01020 [Flavobacterium sp.]|nr:MAG: hypothetical protein EOO46_01020 [Flavobacterium sp.]